MDGLELLALAVALLVLLTIVSPFLGMVTAGVMLVVAIIALGAF